MTDAQTLRQCPHAVLTDSPYTIAVHGGPQDTAQNSQESEDESGQKIKQEVALISPVNFLYIDREARGGGTSI